MASQLEKCKAEVVGLKRKVHELQGKLQSTGTSSSEPPDKLATSSVELYVGIAIAISLAVFQMTWWFRIPLFVILTAVCCDFCCRSPFTYRWPNSAKGVVAFIALVATTWTAYGNVHKAYSDQKFPSGVFYMTYWGNMQSGTRTYIKLADKNGQGGMIIGEPASEVGVDWPKVAKFSKEYRLWAVCFHQPGYEDFKDMSVSGSGLFDIDGEQTAIRISWNKQFKFDVIHGESGTNFSLLLIPKKISSPSFATIRDAINKGGIVLQTAGGPP